MTREEAFALLASGEQVPYDSLDEIFDAFGFTSEMELPHATVYYHPHFIDCGIFRARDPYGWRVLSEGQKGLVRYMLQCVAANEARRQERP